PVIVKPLEQLDDEDGLPEKWHSRMQCSKSGKTAKGISWKKNMKGAKDKLENEMEDAYDEHQVNLLHQDLIRSQEELRRIEEMQKCKELQLKREGMTLQKGIRNDSKRHEDGDGGAKNLGDLYGSGDQKFPSLAAAMSGSMMESNICVERFGQGGAKPVGGQGPRGMGPGTP
ncbi:Splicing factor, proline- and glutamine-rich, partial [Galemys pyrenaicus]